VPGERAGAREFAPVFHAIRSAARSLTANRVAGTVKGDRNVSNHGGSPSRHVAGYLQTCAVAVVLNVVVEVKLPVLLTTLS
jgi:hypothetical protein